MSASFNLGTVNVATASGVSVPTEDTSMVLSAAASGGDSALVSTSSLTVTGAASDQGLDDQICGDGWGALMTDSGEALDVLLLLVVLLGLPARDVVVVVVLPAIVLTLRASSSSGAA